MILVIYDIYMTLRQTLIIVMCFAEFFLVHFDNDPTAYAVV